MWLITKMDTWINNQRVANGVKNLKGGMKRPQIVT